jgi:YceI-like protein
LQDCVCRASGSMTTTRTREHPSRRDFKTWLWTALAVTGTIVVAGAAEPPLLVDTSQSAITVRVFKTGLFRSLGDNHEIHAVVKAGFINDTLPIQASIVVDARDLRVQDPNASQKDREQVQARMLGPEVLDADRFPEIRFESRSGERTESGAWTLRGQLTLHGQSRTLTITITEDRGHYRGSITLRQTDYGITPISVAGGAVRVKDELKIDFDIVARHATTTGQ